jgi:hypothetical protein
MALDQELDRSHDQAACCSVRRMSPCEKRYFFSPVFLKSSFFAYDDLLSSDQDLHKSSNCHSHLDDS